MMIHDIPLTMKAVQCVDYGDVDAVMSIKEGVRTPRLQDLPTNKQRTSMLVKVLAVALAPGDCRVLSGITREVQGPPSFPYVPGGDCCGTVMDLPESPYCDNLPFRVGDRVVARFVERPRGALGEYALVSTNVAAAVPESISSEDAAALISASPAIDLAEAIRPGERLLVLGAGGGIGSHFCQLLRLRGASYIVGVSRSPDLLQKIPIACDEAIDYTTTDVFSLEQFQQQKFDTIVDLAGLGFKRLEECRKGKESLIVKTASTGGRFLTTIPPCGPIYEIHSWWGALKVFLFPCLWKAILSRTIYRSELPKYTFCLAIASNRTPAIRAMDLAATERLKAVQDPLGPFPFTTDGVRSAFKLQESRHPHGKVVIRVSEA